MPDYYNLAQGRIEDLIQNLYKYKTPSLSLGGLDKRANQVYGDINSIGLNNLLAGQRRSAQEMGSAAGSQGFAMNQSNPFAMVNRAQARAYDNFTPQFGQLNQMIAAGKGNAMMQNPMTAWNTQFQTDQSHLTNFMNLLAQQMGYAGADIDRKNQKEQAQWQAAGDFGGGILSLLPFL